MKTLVLPLLLLPFLFTACTSMEEKRDSRMQSALAAEKAGDCAAARKEALEATELDPLFADAHLVLARCAVKEDRIQDAAASFAKVLELKPDSVEALTGASRAALLAEDADKASAYAEKALTIGGETQELNLLRAAVFIQRRDFAAALPLFEKAVEKAPNNEEAVTGLTSAYINTGERQKALDLLKNSLEKMPQSPALLALLLTLSLQDNDLEAAKGYVQRLLPLRPEDPALILQLSGIHFLEGRQEESRAVLTGFLKKIPASEQVRIRLAEMDAEQGEFDRALTTLGEAPAQSGLIRLTRASVLGRSGRTSEAESLLRELLADPSATAEAVEARLGLVEIALESGRVEEAEKELSLLLEKDPQNDDALFLRGRIYFSMGRFADAVSDFTKVTELDENDLDAALALADAYNASRNPERAEAIISDVIKRAPKFALAYTTLANLYMMGQKPDAALMTLDIGKKELPQDPTLPVLQADILASQKRYAEARSILEGLARQEAYREGARMRLAAISGAAGEHSRAGDAYALILKDNPDNLAAAEGRMRALIAAKKEKEALAFAEKRQKERPTDPRAAYMTGEAALANKDNAKAETAFLRALELAPGWDQPLTVLAQYYTATQRIEKAMELARNSMSKAPEVPGPAIVLAMLQEEKGDLDGAEATYRAILVNDPEVYLAANNLAFLLSRHKADPARLQEAEEFARSAAAGAAAPATFDTLGWIRFLRGNDAGAEEVLRQALQGLPGSPTIQFHLASALAAQGKDPAKAESVAKKDEAKALLKAALESKEAFPHKAEAQKLYDSLQ